jgi:hypothetical protein
MHNFLCCAIQRETRSGHENGIIYCYPSRAAAMDSVWQRAGPSSLQLRLKHYRTSFGLKRAAGVRTSLHQSSGATPVFLSCSDKTNSRDTTGFPEQARQEIPTLKLTPYNSKHPHSYTRYPLHLASQRYSHSALHYSFSYSTVMRKCASTALGW